MDYEKIIDIPFGAFDSELVYQEINIPDGFEATIEGNTIIFKKENKDEKIRKAIICGMNALKNQKKKTFATIPIDDCIDWLKKQGNKLRGKTALEAIKEEKVDNANKVEPKFKVGDWVVTNYGKVNQVVAIDDDCDGFTLDDGTYFSGSWKNYYHLWTIHDAKNGDVLVDVYGNISIYEKCDDFDWMSYCSLGHNGGFQHFKIEHENEKTYPATKEQRDLLFRKMKEAG